MKDKKLPPETEGSIQWEEDMIVVKSNYEEYHINTKTLCYVSVMAYLLDGKAEISLCVVDSEPEDYYRKKYMPLHYKGFGTAWQMLQKVIAVEKNAFDQVLIKFSAAKKIDSPYEKLLWRKNERSNFNILQSYPLDFREGYEILGPAPAFIRWNSDLKKLTHQYPDHFSENGGTTQYPVRIGNIEILQRVETDWWNLKLFAPGRGADCYFMLKKALLHLTQSKDFTAHENDAEKSYYLYIRVAPITFRLNYPFGEPNLLSPDYFFDPDLLVLSIEIDPPKSYDANQIGKIKVDHVINLPEDVRLGFYQQEQHPEVFTLPLPIQQAYGTRPFIWIDNTAAYVGFTDGKIAWHCDLKKIYSFNTYALVRGPGESARLCIDEEIILECKGAFNPFVKIAPELERLTGKEVTILGDIDSGY